MQWDATEQQHDCTCTAVIVHSSTRRKRTVSVFMRFAAGARPLASCSMGFGRPGTRPVTSSYRVGSALMLSKSRLLQQEREWSQPGNSSISHVTVTYMGNHATGYIFVGCCRMLTSPAHACEAIHSRAVT